MVYSRILHIIHGNVEENSSRFPGVQWFARIDDNLPVHSHYYHLLPLSKLSEVISDGRQLSGECVPISHQATVSLCKRYRRKMLSMNVEN